MINLDRLDGWFGMDLICSAPKFVWSGAWPPLRTIVIAVSSRVEETDALTHLLSTTLAV